MKIAVYTRLRRTKPRWAASSADTDSRLLIDTGSADSTAALLRDLGVTVSTIAIEPFRFDVVRNVAGATR